jgi:uncharacterized membrane protein YheB (UPF0754 family)
MNWIGLSTTILLSTFVGWFTTWVAIKALFHPRKPIKILGVTIQGIFPKNQQVIAQKLGQVVSNDLISFVDIESQITDPENLQKLKPEIENHIDDFLRNRLKDTFPLISMFIGDKTINQLKEAFLMELEELFPVLMKKYMVTMQDKLDLEKIVTEKVATLSSGKLEDILHKITKNEFLFLEFLSAIFGFLIGTIQVLVTILTS